MAGIDRHDRSNSLISVRKADAQDAELLFSVCRQSYVESFADHWNDGGLSWYLDKVYGLDVLERDLTDKRINYFIAYYDNVPAGFMKLKLNSILTDKIGGKHLEIEKLYFLTRYKRKGLGRELISTARRIAKDLEMNVIWLGVIDTNASAISFYERNGFDFFDKTRLEIPYFKDELRGMWRMMLKAGGEHQNTISK
jgi:ribosomal protein S18 acetylase RimI-like enzyme